MIAPAFALLLLLTGHALAAGERVNICYNYDCAAQAAIVYQPQQMNEIDTLLHQAGNAAEERQLLAQALGRLYGWAGEQSPIGNDRGGNYADGGVSGGMDCIDHSTSSSRLLRLLERRGALRWHRVLEPQRRVLALVLFQHFSAVIEEAPRLDIPSHVPVMLAHCNCQFAMDDVPKAPENPARFAVDSWFVDNGKPAVILPLAEWLDGGGPDVE